MAAAPRTVFAVADINRCVPSAVKAIAACSAGLLSVPPVSLLPRAARPAGSQRRPILTTRCAPNAGESGLSGRRPSDSPRIFSIHTSEGLPPPGPTIILDDLPSIQAHAAGAAGGGSAGGAAGSGAARASLSDPAVQAEAAAFAVEEAAERAEELVTDKGSEPEVGPVAGGAGSGGEGPSGGELGEVLGEGQAHQLRAGQVPPGVANKCRINILVDIPVD